MGVWTDPKVDWTAASLVPETELNKVGENLEYLYDSFQVSGRVGGETINLATVSYHLLSNHGIFIPDGHELYLRRIHGLLVGEYSSLNYELNLHINVLGETPYTTVNPNTTVYEEPDTILYANASGSDVTTYVQTSLYNPQANTLAVKSYSAWTVLFDVRGT